MSAPAGRGVVAVLGAAALWGCIGVLSVGLFARGVSPWEVAFWRAALSAAALALAAPLLPGRVWRVPAARDLGVLCAFGALGVGVFYIAFQLATYLTSVAVAVILLYLAPVLVVLAGRLLLGEALTTGRVLSVAVVLVGIWATVLGAADAEIRLRAAGIAWGVVSAVAYAAYYLFGKLYLPRYGVPRTLLYSLSAGTLLLGVAGWAAGHPPRLDHAPGSWALLLALALGTTLLANGLYYYGITRIEAGHAAVVASVEPAVAALLAWMALGQRLTPVGWIGIALVVVGAGVVPALWRDGRGTRVAPPADPAGPAAEPGGQR